jgi:hypothetical protein
VLCDSRNLHLYLSSSPMDLIHFLMQSSI